MDKRIMDTQELSEIRNLIGNDPAMERRAGAFDLEEILAEVENTVGDVQRDKERKSTPSERVLPSAINVHVFEDAKREQELPRESVQGREQETPPATAKPREKARGKTQEKQQSKSHGAPPPRVVKNDSGRTEAEPMTPREKKQQQKARDKDERRAERIQEKARRREEKEIARSKQDAEDEYRARDPRVVVRTCTRRARSLGGRSLFVLMLGLAATYISIAEVTALPLPSVLRFGEQTLVATLTLMILQFLAMLTAVDIVGMGFYGLFTGAVDRKTLVSCGAVAALLHGLSMIVMPTWDALLPYCCIHILLLYALMRDERARLLARYNIYHTAMMTTRPINVFVHDDQRDSERRSLKHACNTAEPFLTELEKPDTADRFALIYAPIVLAASMIFALIASVGQGYPSRFPWALASILSLSAPFGLLCAAGKPLQNVSRILEREGAALVGVRTARKLAKASQVAITDADLFPTGCIVIDGVNNYSRYDNEKLLAYAAALTGGQRLEIGHVFAEALRLQYGRPVKASGVLQYESGGLSGDIGADSVMVGTAAFLKKLNVRTNDTHGVENAVYVVINSNVACAFAISYHPTAQTYGALHDLRRLRQRPLLVTLDFNLSPAVVESLFELRGGSTDETTIERAALIRDPAYVQHDDVCAILTRDGIAPFTMVLKCAQRLTSVVNMRLILSAFAGLGGVLLVFYLSFLYVTSVLTPRNLLLYLILWYIPAFFIGLESRGRG